MRNVSCPLILLEMFVRSPVLLIVDVRARGFAMKPVISGKFCMKVQVSKMSLYQW